MPSFKDNMDKGGFFVFRKQLIKCSVRSCIHNTGDGCALKGIQVSPCRNMNSGLPDDESMCSSYESEMT